MTLIIGAVCDRFVVLVADRRITTTNASGEVTDQEDLHTKTVFLDGRYIMGFTGLARLGPKNDRMEQWLLEEALKASGGADYSELLAERNGKALEEAGYGVNRGSTRAHVFLAVGYDAADEPEVVLVSNYHDLDGNVVGPTYPHSSNAIHLSLSGKRNLIAHVGSLDLTDAERGYLYREARPSSRHDRPTRLVNAMLKVLRDASHRSEGKIGTAAVVSIMPRGAVPVSFNPTFMNWPGDAALASSIHMSFAVPDENKRQDGRVTGPLSGSRREALRLATGA